MNRTCSLTMMNVSSKIQHKCFFFSPSAPFIYLFITPSEIRAVFGQSDEKAKRVYGRGGGREEACQQRTTPSAPRDRGLLQMDIGLHQSASNCAGKA